MFKLLSVGAAVTVLLVGAVVLAPPAFAYDRDQPILAESPLISYLLTEKYLELRYDSQFRSPGPIKPPPGIKPVDPNTGEARSTAAMVSMSRGGGTVLSPGGGSGFSLGAGSSAPAATDRSPRAALSALAGANEALGY
jgi:hypothetical protein